MPKLVTDMEYVMVADTLGLIGDFSQSEQYWDKAIKSSPDAYNKSLNIRSYARSLFRQGHYEKGRRKFEESLNTLTIDNDQMRYSKGETYRRWAIAEANASFYTEAERLFELAKTIYENIGNKHLKNTALERLDGIRKSISQTKNK